MSVEPVAYMPQDEQIMVAACLAGDIRAWESMVYRHQESIYNLVARLLGVTEAEDVTQEVFLRAFRSLKGFRGDCRLSTWLYRIAVNFCRDKARKLAHRRVVFSLDEPIMAEEGQIGRQLADSAPSPHELLENSELSAQVVQALQRLSEMHRTVLVLHDMQGLRYDDVAKVMGCTLGTVKSRLFYARRKLGKILADYCHS